MPKILQLLNSFKKTVVETLLFLRSVSKITVQVFDGSKVSTLFSAAIHDKDQRVSLWDQVPRFIGSTNSSSEVSKNAFYRRLEVCQSHELPSQTQSIRIVFSDSKKGDNENDEASEENDVVVTEDTFLVCNQVGGGRARQLAIDANRQHLKLLPWGGVAVHIARNEQLPDQTKGRAFCFLPLPVETGLPVHVSAIQISELQKSISFISHFCLIRSMDILNYQQTEEIYGDDTRTAHTQTRTHPHPTTRIHLNT